MFPITGASVIMLALIIIAVFGAAHLLAASHSDNIIAKSWLSLGF